MGTQFGSLTASSPESEYFGLVSHQLTINGLTPFGRDVKIMKPKLHITIITCFVLFFGTARADDNSEFPRIGVEYKMIYSAPKVTTENGKNTTEDRVITLRIIKVQPNGWVFASPISYDYIRSTPTPQNGLGEIIGKQKRESDPMWFNLSTFSQAIELKEK